MKSQPTTRSEGTVGGSAEARATPPGPPSGPACDAPSAPFTRSDSFRYDDEGLVEHQITFTSTHGSSAGRCHSNTTANNPSCGSGGCGSSGGCGGGSRPRPPVGESTRCAVRSSCSDTDCAGSSVAPCDKPIPKGVLLLGSALLIGVAVLLGVACLSRANKEHPAATKQ